MEISRKWKFSWLLLGLFFLAHSLQTVTAEAEVGPSESECRPYIEKALKDLETAEITETEHVDDSPEDAPDVLTEGSEHDTGKPDSVESLENLENKEQNETPNEKEDTTANTETSIEVKDEQSIEVVEETEKAEDVASLEEQASIKEDETSKEAEPEEPITESVTNEEALEKSAEHTEEAEETEEEGTPVTVDSKETPEEEATSIEEQIQSAEEHAASVEEQITPQNTEEQTSIENDAPLPDEQADEAQQESIEEQEPEKLASIEDSASVEDKAASLEHKESVEQNESAEQKESVEEKDSSVEENIENQPSAENKDESAEQKEEEAKDTPQDASSEKHEEPVVEAEESDNSIEEPTKDEATSVEEPKEAIASENAAESEETKTADNSENDEEAPGEEEEKPEVELTREKREVDSETTQTVDEAEEGAESKESLPEEELIFGIEIPESLRPREHLDQILKLDDDNSDLELTLNRVSEVTLRELKRLYESAIKPLETLYKYRDLSNRHFGDSEIFSKPLVLFMGPWSGGKSSIINYLTDNEYNLTSLRTGAEPSPAYFNLVMHGEEPEVLDGTQLAADFTFAGLQKFGQGLEERLRGLKLPNKLLEKINIVEIPGILEVRKQVSRVFPFNDACQWFIDRADIIFLVYDPSKLDVGPETEAILDQLKGREHQTRIVLNKADQVKPEELMRVQSALIWNISPLMSSAQPPAMYTTSLWSRPYESWAPIRLLQAQEREFLRDLRSAIDKRIENKIASARRFAVRVRNHAKMVDCYLTTYYNHKSVFGNRKQVADQIIEHPQDYHIYEGLSTLTNISRYDLPDPDVYRDFFRLNPLYEFQQLSATCTYFRGCPINRLDVAIAYDLPELVGKHKKLLEAAVAKIKTES